MSVENKTPTCGELRVQCLPMTDARSVSPLFYRTMSVPGKQRTIAPGKIPGKKYMYAKTAAAKNDADNNSVVSPRDLLLEEMKCFILVLIPLGKILHFHVRLAERA